MRTASLLAALLFSASSVMAFPYGTASDLEAAAKKLEGQSWPTVSQGGLLKQGATGKRVDEVVKRLKAAGHLQNAQPDKYDERVAQAVKAFQRERGLKVDGLVGKNTLAALNRSPADIAQTLRKNAKRMREAGDLAGMERLLITNIPDMRLYLLNSGSPELSMDVVVGQEGWGTPTMDDELEHVVVNPTWNVPKSIATEEIAPKVLENPNYLEENNMVVLEGGYTGDNVREIPASQVDWQAAARGDFDYFIRQNPGDDNPLGRVKFLFPNNEAIYFHDTNAPSLLERDDRALSHGCIRLDKPMELAHAILEDDQGFDAALSSGETKWISVEPTIPVRLVYWTAWVDSAGKVQLRPDIYGLID